MLLFMSGAVAQLGARFDGIEEVAGSNPAGSTSQMTPLKSDCIPFRDVLTCRIGFHTIRELRRELYRTNPPIALVPIERPGVS